MTGLRERLRRFVDDQVIPIEVALDSGDVAAREELRRRARADRLWALALPVEYGGAGLPLVEYLAVAEQEGRSDHGPDATGSGCLLNARMIAAHADPAVRSEVLPSLVGGDLAVSYAMTEPGVAGSDPAALRTTAVPDRSGAWSVSGRKWFTSGADRADLVIVIARTDPDAPPRSAFTMLVVPTRAAGFTVHRELDVLGVGGQHEIVLDGVRVPPSHVLGTPGSGLALAGERLGLGRTLRALRWVGQAQRALEMLARRAAQRRLGDGVLADQQLVQRMAFEAELQVRSARLLTAQAADRVARGDRAPVEVSLAKVAAARALGEAVDAAIQVFGAEGLTAVTGLPRLLRWARAARILDGADELHITTTAARLIRGYNE